VAGDFTGTGRIDLATANFGSNDVSVLLGKGDGTFGAQVTYPVGTLPDGLAAGDFSSNARTDLAVANLGSNDVSVLLGNGDGTFQPQVTYPVGANPGAVVAGEFTGDGRTDLATTNYGSDSVSVLLGKGDGRFGPQTTYPVGSAPGGLIAADFNRDGRTDLAVANIGDSDVSLLLGNGDGTFAPQVTYPVGSASNELVAGDFNGDGWTGLATANSATNNISVLLNLGGGTFAAPGPFVTTPRATPVMADLTGDGVDDVLVVNASGDILWRRGNLQAPGTYAPPMTINPGHPSRDIVTVQTNQGLVLASVDATDDAIMLYAWRNGSVAPIGSLPTGLLPAQIATADLTGNRTNDLVLRNAGDGTVSIYFNTQAGSGPYSTLLAPFLTPVTLTVGPGVSGVTLADLSRDGRADIVVTYRATGEVGVLRNLGGGTFAPVVLYPAGSGLYAVSSAGSAAVLTTFEGTAGVTAGALTAGGPADLVAIDPGSNTVSVLSGLSGGRFANPVTLPTPSPAIAVKLADLEGHGIPDVIILSASGVTVYRGDGKGGFLPDPFTIAAGPEPTGMNVADVNGDGKPDVLVSNAYGDLLVLLGNGDGTFAPYHSASQSVALAVLPNGSAKPDFIFSDQGLDRVVVDYAGGQTKTVADRTSGLLAPGAVKLADLNGDGIPDLIVANSGSNNVLVYPGLGNGQFGPELNGGKGFFTGTNPVSITVANLNGRPDLVVANQGSNDVSILLNVATADGGFTFVSGPRLQGGLGPTSTVVAEVNGDTFPDLLISDGGSNQVLLLRGVGGGFFADQDPRIYSVGNDPVQVMVGPFLPNQGLEILTVNRGSNDLTVISDFSSSTPVFNTVSTGGTEPVAAFGVTVPGQLEESVVVANQGNGVFTLLGGVGGLKLEQTQTSSDLPEPTALDFAAVSESEVMFYATTAGQEVAFTLEFVLPGFLPTGSTTALVLDISRAVAVAEAPAQLVALSEDSLTLLVTVLNPAPGATLPAAVGNPAEVNTSFLSVPPSQGQSLFSQLPARESEGDETVQPTPETPVAQGATAPPWVRSILGADEMIQEIRQENRDVLLDDGVPAATGESPRDQTEDPPGLLPPGVPACRVSEPDHGLSPGPGAGLSLSLTVARRSTDVDRHTAAAVDQAIDELGSAERPPVSCQPAVSAWVPVLMAYPAVVRANRPGRPQRGVRQTHP
jgi:hypothetical protein